MYQSNKCFIIILHCTLYLFFVHPVVCNINDVTTLIGTGIANTTDGMITSLSIYNNNNTSLSIANVDSPSSLAIDSISSLLYFTESRYATTTITGTHCIRVIYLQTGIIRTIAGQTAAGPIDGAGTNALFTLPNALVYDTVKRILYITDNGNNKIRSYQVDTKQVKTVAGTLFNGTPGYVDGKL